MDGNTNTNTNPDYLRGYSDGYRDGSNAIRVSVLDALADFLRTYGDTAGAAYFDALRNAYRAHLDNRDAPS